MTGVNVAKTLKSALASFTALPICYDQTAPWTPPDSGGALFIVTTGARRQVASGPLYMEPVILSLDLRTPRSAKLAAAVEAAEALRDLLHGRTFAAPIEDSSKGHLYCIDTQLRHQGPVNQYYRLDVIATFEHFTQ